MGLTVKAVLALGACLSYYYLPADIIMIIMSSLPAWSLHDCPAPANEACSVHLDTCQPPKLWRRSRAIYLFICIKIKILGPLFSANTANTLFNVPVKMKMKAAVNYLPEQSARQINSNKKTREESLLPAQLVNVLIWGAVYKVHWERNEILNDHTLVGRQILTPSNSKSMKKQRLIHWKSQ